MRIPIITSVAAFALLAVQPPSYAQDNPTEPAVATSGASTASQFSVHEWGVIQFESGVAHVASTSPTTSVPTVVPTVHIDPPSVRKPIVYLTPDTDFDYGTSIEVTVSIADGILREVWPTPNAGPQPAHDSDFSWSVSIEQGTCGPELAPAEDHAACIGLMNDDIMCESAEMGSYMSDAASCLDVDGTRTPALVYNGLLNNLDHPTVEHGVLNAGSVELAGVWVNAGNTVIRMQPVGSDGTSELASGTSIELADFEAEVTAALSARGLRDNEVADFIAAWRSTLFVQTPGENWQVFGLYAAGVVEALAPMTVEPAPYDTPVRVLAFSVVPS